MHSAATAEVEVPVTFTQTLVVSKGAERVVDHFARDAVRFLVVHRKTKGIHTLEARGVHYGNDRQEVAADSVTASSIVG